MGMASLTCSNNWDIVQVSRSTFQTTGVSGRPLRLTVSRSLILTVRIASFQRASQGSSRDIDSFVGRRDVTESASNFVAPHKGVSWHCLCNLRLQPQPRHEVWEEYSLLLFHRHVTRRL